MGKITPQYQDRKIEEYRRIAYTTNVVSLDEPLMRGKDNSPTLGDTVRAPQQSPEEYVYERELQALIRDHILPGLKEKEQYIIRGVFYRERRLEDLAVEIGISRAGAYDIHDRALKKIGNRLERFRLEIK